MSMMFPISQKMKNFGKEVRKHKGNLLLFLIPFVFLIVFKYVPMYGIVLAFKDFNLKLGILKSPFSDPIYQHFLDFFNNRIFYQLIRNTLVISSLKIFIAFPVPIIFALLLNEVRSVIYRKFAQTVSYLPHFISWVVLSAVFIDIFSTEGPVNAINKLMGNTAIVYMSKSEYFWAILTITHIWKTFGWSSIIYFAALAGVDATLYEAAVIDGAGRFRQVVSITIPSIMPTIVILMILSMGDILNAGFDQIFNMMNKSVADVGNILDTYVYEQGLKMRNYSFATAVGLFKSAIGLIMITVVNKTASLIDKESTLW
jgi:putative aldouronate transport system permease protein